MALEADAVKLSVSFLYRSERESTIPLGLG